MTSIWGPSKGHEWKKLAEAEVFAFLCSKGLVFLSTKFICFLTLDITLGLYQSEVSLTFCSYQVMLLMIVEWRVKEGTYFCWVLH